MVMLSQPQSVSQAITEERRRAAAVDLLIAARSSYDQATLTRNRVVAQCAGYLSQRRIAEITGWDRGTIRRILAAAE